MLCKGVAFRKSVRLNKIFLLNKSFTLGKNRFVRLIVLDRRSC